MKGWRQAHGGLRERAVMLVIIVVVLAISSLALYAMRNKVRFKVSATALKWFSFSVEVESDDHRDGVKQLPSSAANGQNDSL
jgi:hypothetical protein